MTNCLTVAFDKLTSIVGDAMNKIYSYNKSIQPLYFSECEKLGLKIGNLIRSPQASEYISTALKILPLTLLLFTLSCCLSPIPHLVAGGFAAVVILTQKDFFLSESKKQFLLSCASATLLDTVFKVALAASTLAAGAAIGYLVAGAVVATGLFVASNLVKV
jgi:hypothetical protein